MKIDNNILNHPNLPNFNDVKEKLLNDNDVIEFINKFKDILTTDIIDVGLSSINEFIVSRKDPYYKCELGLYNGQIYTRYMMRDKVLQQKYRDKVPSKFITDKTTNKFRGITFDSLDEDMNNIQVINFCKQFIKNYRYGDKSKGIWLHGDFGRGKSYILGAFANELSKRQVGVTYVSASQMMTDILASMSFDSSSSNFEKQLNRLMKSEILIIDDIGTEKQTNFTINEVIYTIMKHRGEYNKPTFLSSNLTKNDYYIQLNDSKQFQRMDIARLKEQLDVLMKEMQLSGVNRRNKA